MKTIFALLCILVSPAFVVAQQKLTDAEVQTCIDRGMKEKPYQVGLHLIDTGATVAAVMNGGDTNAGFSLTLYTPSTWIEAQAAEAHRLMKPFSLTDVTEDMRLDVVRVLVSANTPLKVTANGVRGSSNVDHVVLQNAAKTEVLQPIKEESSEQMVASAVSSQFSMHGQVAQFSLDAVNKLRGPSGDGEFYITVIGTKQKRDFKVKAKHFAKL